MTRPEQHNTRLGGVLVPHSLVADVRAFGGEQRGDCLYGDLVFCDGGQARLLAPSEPPRQMVVPRFTDPHVHLDKCHTIGRMTGIGGDLASAVAAQKNDKANWSEEDLQARAKRGLAELEQAGCGTVRSHVDWGETADQPPLAWDVLRALAGDTPVTLQVSALTGVDLMADPTFAAGVARRVARDGGVLGAFVLDQADRDAGLANTFAEADRYGLALDFHVDEGLERDLDGLERIADAALACNFEGPILCGHACSLASLPAADVSRIADKLARAGIAVAMLPQTNLYLQGRTDGTPERRGITRIKELRAAGVTVTVGADNVRDAFCPIGRHDPLYVLSLAALTAHLDPPYADHLPLITSNARKSLGLSPLTVDTATAEDLLVFAVTDSSELLSGAAFQPMSAVVRSLR